MYISRSVYSLGNQDHFNDMLKDTDRNFTFIVPSNQAWNHIKDEYTSAHKVLFLGTFAYQVPKEVHTKFSFF